MTRRRIGCHSEERNDEESQSMLDPFGYILAEEILSMHIEPEDPVWVDPSAEWSNPLDSSLRSE